MHFNALKKKSNDRVVASLVQTKREDLYCPEDPEDDYIPYEPSICEDWVKRGRPKSISYLVECWDGMFYGKDINSGVTVSICRDFEPGEVFGSLDSWPAKLIKSLVVTVGSDASHPSPSFSCAQSTNDAERRICDHAELSGQDARLADLYKNLRAAIGKGAIRQLETDQRAWIKQRNACTKPPPGKVKCFGKRSYYEENCIDLSYYAAGQRDCIAEAYDRRIGELCTRYPVKSGPLPACKPAAEAAAN
jgi:uncharacterized protein